MYTGNYDILLKKIKEDLNKLKDISCPWIGRLNIDKMAMLSNRVRRFNVTPMVIPMKSFCISEKANPQIHRGLQRTLNSNKRTKLVVEEQRGGTLLDF